MKIALVILHADPSRGGAERYTIDLAGVLRRRGHSVGLIASSFSQAPPGVHQVSLNATGLTRGARYERFLDLLDEHLACSEYDVVHAMLPVRQCDVYHPHAGIAVAEMQKWTVHFNPRRKLMARVETEMLASPSPPLVLCLSQYVKDTILQLLPRIDPLLETLFNAVDLEKFEPASRPRPDDRVRALFIAQDFERKGLKPVIEALARISDSRLQLIVAGGDEPGAYESLARNLGIEDRVDFVGAVADPRPLYRKADFFVLPTRHDPCSLVVLEALAMGIPVISTRFNGACEIMTDQVHGYVLSDPTNTAELAEAMQKLLDPPLRTPMSKACLSLRPKLSYENHLSALIEIYGRAHQRRQRQTQDRQQD